jgi:hypothetical protein
VRSRAASTQRVSIVYILRPKGDAASLENVTKLISQVWVPEILSRFFQIF